MKNIIIRINIKIRFLIYCFTFVQYFSYFTATWWQYISNNKDFIFSLFKILIHLKFCFLLVFSLCHTPQFCIRAPDLSDFYPSKQEGSAFRRLALHSCLSVTLSWAGLLLKAPIFCRANQRRVLGDPAAVVILWNMVSCSAPGGSPHPRHDRTLNPVPHQGRYLSQQTLCQCHHAQSATPSLASPYLMQRVAATPWITSFRCRPEGHKNTQHRFPKAVK